jgi:putative ABC transport system ATP-binding protein
MANLMAKTISHSFTNGTSWVLKNWTAEFEPHSITALTGPSGCGKSTLLHILGGLLTPTSGHVLLHNRPMYACTPTKLADAINQHIGFVFQRSGLLPELSVWDNIALKHRLGHPKAPVPTAFINHWLNAFSLWEFRHASPATLSGGQAHRVAFIRALINTPSVLLCDEPTGNLDAANTDCILNAVHTIRTETPCSIVIATHDERIAQMGDATYDLTPRAK